MLIKSLIPPVSDFQQSMAHYLFEEKTNSEHPIISAEAQQLKTDFLNFLQQKKVKDKFVNSLKKLDNQPLEQLPLILHWLKAYLEKKAGAKEEIILEAAVLLMEKEKLKRSAIDVDTAVTIPDLHGEHPRIKEGNYAFDYHSFVSRIKDFQLNNVLQFQQLQQLKKNLSEQAKQDLRLTEFKPRVLSSFVRNQLIDKVYLHLLGDNLAKQIGTAGENTRTDRMGLLLLISPPGYGKTTLMEYLANLLGLIFMKINGPALGHQVVSLDPADAPNSGARQELEKLNLAFEMGDNVMIYVDDIQHCHPEFLQKFISLCDAQRKIEGVWKGRSKTYDFRGKRVAVVMAGNPFTERGEKFQIPDMLANRADIYNLGDMIGDNAAVFKLSYIENALTSNAVLSRLANKSMKDVYSLLQRIEKGNKENLSFEASHSPEELNEYNRILQKLLRIRDVVLMVNQAYIQSAATNDAYRTEPAFKLQGSYRNMNKMAEKVVAVMNDQELESLIMAHYEGEVQTLTADAEANQLKLKELMGNLTADEEERWTSIKAIFVKNNAAQNLGVNHSIGKMISEMNRFSAGIEGIQEILEKGLK